MGTMLRMTWALALFIGLAGCAPNNDAFEFQQAVQLMSHGLMQKFTIRSMAPLQQMTAAIGGAAGVAAKRDPSTFVIDPFIDGDSGNATTASNTVTRIVTAEIAVSSAQYKVLPLSSDTVKSARYVVTGATKYETYLNTGAKRYRIYGAIVDLSDGSVVANAATWVSDPKIDDVPLPFYKNSPMYLKDASVNRQLQVAVTPDASGGTKYAEALSAAAITSEGSTSLEHGDYTRAIQLFKSSIHTADGETMRNYSGLYQSYVKLNQKSDAESAFYKMFALAVENNNVKMKFLFSVGSTEFIADPNLRAQYDLWLRPIAQFLSASQTCMEISGHASHTGTADFNRTLSLHRAELIKSRLSALNSALGARLSAVGKGFDENIVGTGTDDDQDAVDRRVEFKPRGCGLA